MESRATIIRTTGLGLLVIAAVASLGWGCFHAFRDSADLERRIEEVELFLNRIDPFTDPDMTYPPSAPPIFAALLAPVPSPLRRGFWLALNLAALALVARQIGDRYLARLSPSARLAGFIFIIASRPVRMGIALGQFHIIPVVAVLAATRCLNSENGRISRSLWLALALIKPTVAAPFLILLVIRRQWFVLGAAVSLHVASWLATASWVGASPITLVREWLALAATQEGQGTVDLPTWASKIPMLQGIPSASWSLLVLAIAACLLYRHRRLRDSDLIPLTCLAAATCAYHRPYDMVLLLPPLFWIISPRDLDARRWVLSPFVWITAIALAGFLILPSHRAVAGWLDPYFIPGLAVATLGAVAATIQRLDALDRRSPGAMSAPAVDQVRSAGAQMDRTRNRRLAQAIALGSAKATAGR
jgi:hypothetical protein